MPAEPPARYRGWLEGGVLAAIIYVILGTPGLDLQSWSKTRSEQQVGAMKVAKTEALVKTAPDLQCPEHNYKTHIFSSSPLIIYVEDFLAEDEVNHLIAISQDKWQQSTVFNAGVETQDEKVRKSEKALIERDNTVQCIEQRALAFQGWPKNTYIERLWTQRYNVSGHYAHHYDWATASKIARRSSTFMVYLKADCEGGGTEFPRISASRGDYWCRFIECQDGSPAQDGVIFKARERAAVFWENFDTQGRGYRETIHAGMPVTRGTKIGLNIWSWYQAEA